jgi:hypothetical protein
MGLFGNREEKAAKQEADRQESERLAALSVAGLAAEIMPAFGPDGMDVKSGHQQGAMQVTEWLLPAAKVKYRQPVLRPVIEGLKALETAGLLEARSFGGSNSSATTYHPTRLGEEALADGSVARHL